MTAQLWRDRMQAAKRAGVDNTAACTKAQAHIPRPRYERRFDTSLQDGSRWIVPESMECARSEEFEDLDSLAGNIAFKHCDDDDITTRPQLLVTASVDRVKLRRKLRLSEYASFWRSGMGRKVIHRYTDGSWPADHADAP